MKKILVIFAAVVLIFCGLSACTNNQNETVYYYLWEYSYTENDYVISEASYIMLDNEGNGKMIRRSMGIEESFKFTIDGQNLIIDNDSIENGTIRDGVILIDDDYFCNTKIAASPYKCADDINYAIGKDGNYKVIGSKDNNLTSVVIPSQVDGIKVTAVGTNAFSDCDELKSVTLSDNITEIESAAFRNCGALTEIVLPDDLKIIGSNAFEYCNGLTSIELPRGLTDISAFAFRACSKLSSITFPDALTRIGFNAFANCTKLEKIEISKSVTRVETGAFQFCPSLAEITVDPDNNAYTAIDNCLIEKESRTLIFGCKGSSLPKSGISHIAANAFIGDYGDSTIDITAEIKTIGENAFANCSNITSIVIEGSQTKILQSAFINCSSLTSLIINGNGVEIARNAFHGCSQLNQLSLFGVASIGESAFGSCSSLTDLIIPDWVESISENAFGNCTSLASAYIGSNVSKLGMGIFQNCTKLVSLGVSPQNSWFYSQDNCIIERKSLVLVSGCNTAVIPENIRYIAGYAFKGFRIKDITIPDSVVSIYGCAFQDCGNLESITIGQSVKTISDHVFYGCVNLEKIIYKGNMQSWNNIEKDRFWISEDIHYILEFVQSE